MVVFPVPYHNIHDVPGGVMAVWGKFGTYGDGLGILAPQAAEAASLEEYGGADARAVMDAGALQLQYF